MHIELVEAYDQIDIVKVLFQEYAASLGVDLGYQNYDDEYSDLPGKYARSDGRLYLACADGAPAGCAALRRLDAERAEMKRLYVRDAFRGMELGRRLSECVIADARDIGYRALVLDTLSSMRRAQELYRSLGFVETEPYYDCPVEDTVFMRLAL